MEFATTPLHEGFIGCMICAMNADNFITSDELEGLTNMLIERSMFHGVAVSGLIQGSTSLCKTLGRDIFLRLSCEKISEEWAPTIFAMMANMLYKDTLTTAKERKEFLTAARRYLQLPEQITAMITTSFSILYKGKVL